MTLDIFALLPSVDDPILIFLIEITDRTNDENSLNKIKSLKYFYLFTIQLYSFYKI
jgi:hypothetical protein